MNTSTEKAYKVMDSLMTGTEYIIGHPERAFALCLMFIVLAIIARGLGFSAPGKVLYIPATAWLIFAILEWEANRERAYIRIDLLVTWPAIWFLTVASVCYSVYIMLKGSRVDHEGVV